MAVGGSSKPDLVLFVGPVELKNLTAVKFSRPTEVHMIRTDNTSEAFRNLGRQGLEKVVLSKLRRPLSDFRRVAITAYSKGGSFTDQVLRDPLIQDRVDAVILLDALFGSEHEGLKQFFDRAADGEKLLVVTNSNNQASAGLSKRARESVVDLVGDEDLGDEPPIGRMPIPAGGVVRNLGDFFWYDYVTAAGQSQIPHGAHHDLGDEVWEAYLSPYFSETSKFPLLATLGIGVALGTAIWFGTKG